MKSDLIQQAVRIDAFEYMKSSPRMCYIFLYISASVIHVRTERSALSLATSAVSVALDVPIPGSYVPTTLVSSVLNFVSLLRSLCTTPGRLSQPTGMYPCSL